MLHWWRLVLLLLQRPIHLRIHHCFDDFMEGGESIFDAIFDEENLDDVEDVEMLDVEEGELVEKNPQTDLGQGCGGDVNAVSQESHNKNQRRRNKKKKNKRKKGSSGPDVTDINRFVLDTCRHLKERKSYLVWTAVGCLGVSALSDLVKEVDAIQACGGQKTSDGRRQRTGGGILWSILKARDPNAFKEIMKKGKEFEKQFKQPDTRHAPMQNKQALSKVKAASEIVPRMEDQNEQLNIEKKRSVHDRIRVPVAYDDLIGAEDPKDEPNLMLSVATTTLVQPEV